jgi:beta-lactam-binding protein with PASTA domain
MCRIPSLFVIFGAMALVVSGCGSSKTTTTVIKQQPPQPQTVTQTVPSGGGGGGGGGGGSAKKKVPDVVSETLDVAESDLQQKHIAFKEVGGGAFGIVVRSNWDVCQTKPAAGSTVSGSVRLIVRRNGDC